MPTKDISRIFDIGDLRPGHFCGLPIISQWAKNQLRYIYFGASLFEWNHRRIQGGTLGNRGYYLGLRGPF